MDKQIILRGVRTHNLKNLDLAIPLGKITALVGVSGAGKSSLAFHTLYAEGYIRYIESISPYIRQFLEQVEKPDAEEIANLPPAIAFRQRKPVKNPRSIVATAADIFDYLRILYAKIADFYCPQCGRPVRKYTVDQIVGEILAAPAGPVQIGFSYRGDVSFLVNRGYYVHVRDGRRLEIDGRCRNQPIWVLIDEFDAAAVPRSRLFEAVDAAVTLGDDRAEAWFAGQRHVFPTSLGCPECRVEYRQADENLFLFSTPRGACPVCQGMGDVMGLDRDLLLDRSLSLRAGAVRPLQTPAASAFRNGLLGALASRGWDLDRPLGELPAADIDLLVNGDGEFAGARGYFDLLRRKSYKVQARVQLSRYTAWDSCPACSGSRFNRLVLAYRIRGKSIADFLAQTVEEAHTFMRELDEKEYRGRISPDVFAEIRVKLKYLLDSRLPYIHLNRPTFTLSRGEFQRINLAFILGSTLSDSLLVIDQPSADMHARDSERLRGFLDNLKANGNTVLMVEHRPEVVRFADHVIELGPGAGSRGGRVVFRGSCRRFLSSGRSSTAEAFREPLRVEGSGRKLRRWLDFPPAWSHNLKGFTCRVPLHALTAIVGVSGAGKSTLLHNEMYLPHKRLPGVAGVVYLDPGLAAGRGPSNLAAFFDVLTPIREFMAGLKQSRLQGMLPGHFSFHSPLGRCPECLGRGHREIEMQFLPAVRTVCPLCRGTGLQAESLRIRFRGRHIAAMLEMGADDFLAEYGADVAAVGPALQRLRDSGMGYLPLGQKLHTLSSGELQKVRLVRFLGGAARDTLFLIDEPSFGLHPRDLDVVLSLVDQLLEAGHTVVAVEHNLRLVARADWVLELGPEGGAGGGHLLYAGPLAGLKRKADSPTGAFLKKTARTP